MEKESEYVPVWDGNREDERPCRFILRALTSGERNRALPVQVGEGATVTPDFEYVFRKGVVRIEDLEINGERLTKPADVVNALGAYDLFIEVASEIFNRTFGGADSKNSE
jgi:hypothetical protein